MSFPPPRPPSMMAPPPSHLANIPPPPFPFGMIPPPMAAAMMQQQRPPGMHMPPPPHAQGYLDTKKFAPPPGERSAATTTVYVGNISERAPDTLIRQMLQRCGQVLSWKRAQGINGILQTFGFCEFDNPDATLRCIRLLNGYEISEKKLSVKVDQKTREQLSEYIKAKAAKSGQVTKNAKKAVQQRGRYSTAESETDCLNLELVDENTLKDDRVVISSFEILIRQYSKDLMASQPQPPTAESTESSNTPPQLLTPAGTTTTTTSTTHSTTDDLKSPETDSIKIPLSKEEKKENEPSHKEKEKDNNNKESGSAIRHREETSSNSKRDRSEKESSSRNEREREKEKEKERDRERDKDRDRERERERDKDRDRASRAAPVANSPPTSSSDSRHDRASDRYVERDRERERERDRDRYGSQRAAAATPPSAIEESNLRSKSRSRSPVRPKRRNSPPLESKDDLPEEETEEMKERKRLERRMREKEMAYRERLKAWETREAKKKHDYAVERKKERQRKKQATKEAKRLRQFLEDYEDARDDPIHFKGVSLERKLKLREKEIELDSKDRQREHEELEEMKRKLVEKGISGEIVDSEIKRIQNDEDTQMKLKIEKYEQSSNSEQEEEDEEFDNTNMTDGEFLGQQQPLLPSSSLAEAFGVESDKNEQAITADEQGIADESNGKKRNEFFFGEYPVQDSSPQNHNESESSTNAEHKQQIAEPVNMETCEYSPNSNSPVFAGVNIVHHHSVMIKKTSLKVKSIQPVNQLFAEEEEEQNNTSQLKKAKIDSEERKKAVKRLVESIPTDRDELFAYPIDWEQLDQTLMEKRIKPWINKKIIEYIGEEEATLNDFICSKIQQKASPDKLLEEVKVVLDDEAELFVKKMWRLIVYETESKRCGLSK